VAHAYNPTYLGGRDQEDRGSKPAWAKKAPETLSPKPFHKNRAGRVAQGEGPEFKPQYHKKKKKKLKRNISLFLRQGPSRIFSGYCRRKVLLLP
jgi:hypothetical protein